MYIEWLRKAFCFIGMESSVLFVFVFFCCTCPSLSTVNKEKNRTDQRASLRVDTRETQQIIWRRRQDHVISTELRDQKFSASRSIVSTMAETTELIRFKSRDSRWNNKRSIWNDNHSSTEKRCRIY